ncbi:MAG: amidohydrolase family protein [Deltaproteobacteria bacterium]|nr:amidohydrolase family protein [Deltaproteobacteria bacterium]
MCRSRIARGYNNWLFEYCKADRERLKGVALVPLQDPSEAVNELKRCVKDLGSWL